jgi:hypothetical protein
MFDSFNAGDEVVVIEIDCATPDDNADAAQRRLLDSLKRRKKKNLPPNPGKLPAFPDDDVRIIEAE